MADFWIKVEKSTPDKPEVFEISAILNIDPDAVMGKLVRAWAWIDSNSENGHVSSVTNVLINSVVRHEGFAEAMRTVGWLGDDSIPNFDRHMGKTAKKRANDAERKRRSRNTSESCHTLSVTKKGLDKSRVDNKEKAPLVDQLTVDLVDRILDMYDQIIKRNCLAKGFFPESFKKDDKRMKSLLARIRESDEHKNIEFWSNYFERCSGIKWVRDGIDGEAVCTIDMLINKTKFYKNIEAFWA